MTTLRGMTWDHARGYDPLVACEAVWRARTGISVRWDRRSLQDFESFPIEQLARSYDLLVIDHPHVGLVAEQNCLVPFAEGVEAIGPSLESYRWNGQLWALPIDAATQVQCTRPDLLLAPPSEWDEVLALARAGRVLLPLRPPHALMCVMTLAANAGHPPGEADGLFLPPAVGEAVIEQLRELVTLIEDACFEMDPIAVAERMAGLDEKAACAPLIYGYISYASVGFRAARLAFSDIPLPGSRGAALGGTGIAVSSRTGAVGAATATARWLSSAEVQAGLYSRAGGQPAHAAAWADPSLDAMHGGFFSGTRATLRRSYVRPRDAGYMAFQEAAGAHISAALRGGGVIAAVRDLNVAFDARAARPL